MSHLLPNQYSALERIVSRLRPTVDLAKSLKDRSRSDIELSVLMNECFGNDETACAQFIRRNSEVKTTICADVEILEARVTASFEVAKELSADELTEFVSDEFSFYDVESTDYAYIDVEKATARYQYRMRPYAHVSQAA